MLPGRSDLSRSDWASPLEVHRVDSPADSSCRSIRPVAERPQRRPLAVQRDDRLARAERLARVPRSHRLHLAAPPGRVGHRPSLVDAVLPRPRDPVNSSVPAASRPRRRGGRSRSATRSLPTSVAEGSALPPHRRWSTMPSPAARSTTSSRTHCPAGTLPQVSLRRSASSTSRTRRTQTSVPSGGGDGRGRCPGSRRHLDSHSGHVRGASLRREFPWGGPATAGQPDAVPIPRRRGTCSSAVARSSLCPRRSVRTSDSRPSVLRPRGCVGTPSDAGGTCNECHAWFTSQSGPKQPKAPSSSPRDAPAMPPSN